MTPPINVALETLSYAEQTVTTLAALRARLAGARPSGRREYQLERVIARLRQAHQHLQEARADVNAAIAQEFEAWKSNAR